MIYEKTDIFTDFLHYYFAGVFRLQIGSYSRSNRSGGGIIGSETLRGIEKDLERRETVLVERWKEATEAGAKQEVLEALEREIQQTRYGQAGTRTIRETDWTRPETAGPGIGALAALVYAYFTKRKLGQVNEGINNFYIKAEPDKAKELSDFVNNKAS